MPIILASRKLRPEDDKFEVNLCYMVRLFRKQTNKARQGSTFAGGSPRAHLSHSSQIRRICHQHLGISLCPFLPAPLLLTTALLTTESHFGPLPCFAFQRVHLAPHCLHLWASIAHSHSHSGSQHGFQKSLLLCRVSYLPSS